MRFNRKSIGDWMALLIVMMCLSFLVGTAVVAAWYGAPYVNHLLLNSDSVTINFLGIVILAVVGGLLLLSIVILAVVGGLLFTLVLWLTRILFRELQKIHWVALRHQNPVSLLIDDIWQNLVDLCNDARRR